ncbi:MAG: serine hydrolase [Candidatus Muiribacteriota bacterium]
MNFIFSKKVFLFLIIILMVLNIYSVNLDEIYSKIFTNNFDYTEIYSPEFLKTVSTEKIKEITSHYLSILGEFSHIQEDNEKITVFFEKGEAPSTISINRKNMITSIWLGDAKISGDNFEKVLNDFYELGKKISISILKNGAEEIFTYNSDENLGVGSAFKLYILKALQEKIKNRETGWSRVIYLKDDMKTLPSGILQSWPNLSPVTLKTAANLMIQYSDNTATDMLINFLSKEYIEKFTPESLKPFMTTNEFFNLKLNSDNNFRENFFKADKNRKRNLLNTLTENEYSDEKVQNWKNPVDIELVEWFVSTRNLCEIIFDLKNNESIQINPGVANNEDWEKIGFKGGSEPGVFNMTHLLKKNENSDYYSISITVNNSKNPINDNEFIDLYKRALNLLKKLI